MASLDALRHPSRGQKTQSLLPGSRLHIECAALAWRQPCGTAAASATQRQPGGLGRRGQAKEAGREATRARKRQPAGLGRARNIP